MKPEPSGGVERALRARGLTPNDRSIWVDGPGHLGAALHPSGVFVGWIDVAWEGHQPHPRLEHTVHLPAPDRAEVLESELDAALDRARARRAGAVRTCRFCEKTYVPGHMENRDTCQGCAERELGIVH